MRTSTLFALLSIMLAGCASKPAAWSPANVKLTDAVTVPIDLPARGMPIITLARSTANDDANLVTTIGLLDTVSTRSIVSAKYADKHKLDQRTVGDVRVAHIKSIKIGDAELQDFDAVVTDFKNNPNLSDKLDFVLGNSLFANVVLTIDYPNHQLTIQRNAPTTKQGEGLAIHRSTGGEMRIPVGLPGGESWMILDTAFTGVDFMLAPARMNEIKWSAPPIESSRVVALLELPPSQIGRMDGEVHLGAYVLTNPIVAVSKSDPRERVGAEALRNFVVTIDQKDNRVWLSRSSAQPIETPPLRRMGFDFVDAHGKIEVTPGTGAQAAGLLDGDRVISIDGISIDRFKYQQRDSIERTQTSATVRFERDGQEKIARVMLTTVVN